MSSRTKAIHKAAVGKRCLHKKRQSQYLHYTHYNNLKINWLWLFYVSVGCRTAEGNFWLTCNVKYCIYVWQFKSQADRKQGLIRIHSMHFFSDITTNKMMTMTNLCRFIGWGRTHVLFPTTAGEQLVALKVHILYIETYNTERPTVATNLELVWVWPCLHSASTMCLTRGVSKYGVGEVVQVGGTMP